ncbi:MAG: metallophosphoesterase [Planctomycetes bacterium]|nr:metallophosphoesterase [Planctomycetota bacterium]
MSAPNGRLRVGAVGDIHFGPRSESIHGLLAHADQHADVLLLCGDVTNRGLPEEAEALARELHSVKIPVLAVLGNHDYESDRQKEVSDVLADAGVKMLDGDSVEIGGVGFAGVKGFGGGFGKWALAAFGEPSMKAFVRESMEEMLKLEVALARLKTERRIVLLHYSPIQGTVEGEPPDIYPFLGSSHLEEPLNRYEVTAAFHGHAHLGHLEGKTHAGIPVYNVAEHVLRLANPDAPPLKIVEVPLTDEDATVVGKERER